MIINLLIQFILQLLSAVFSIFPEVSISSIPFAGEDIAEILSDMVITWNTFIITFPYAEVAWNMLLWIILPFEALMSLGKFFFGSRLPENKIN